MAGDLSACLSTDLEIECECNPTGDAGASSTVSVEAGQIRKGGYIMIKGKPCKVRDVSVSKMVLFDNFLFNVFLFFSVNSS